MKKFLMMICMMLFSTAMFAQQGAMYVGGGIEFPITDVIKINAEAKYQIVDDWDRPVVSVGIAFAL